jgi:hypothetical protein
MIWRLAWEAPHMILNLDLVVFNAAACLKAKLTVKFRFGRLSEHALRFPAAA